MKDWYVGMKVVCVDDSGSSIVKKGNLYEIEAIVFERGTHWIKLVGVCDKEKPVAGGFYPRRFRPLESKAITLFLSIAQGVTDGKPIVQDDEQEAEEIIAMIFGGGRPIW